MRMIALAGALALTACSSSYMPQTRGRVAVTVRNGQHAYVRDGQVYEHGLLGGGLVEAVQGHPAATRAANEYHDRMTWGFIGALLGLGLTLGGTYYAAREIDVYGDGDGNDDEAAKGLLFVLGGTVVTLIGASYMASAEPYRWDAINMFNDTPPPAPIPAGPPGYGWSAPRTSLRMRD